MGSQPLRAELSEPTTVALGLRPSACKPSRPVSGRGQGRKPPEAVARSASLEAGRSPVYFQHSCSGGETVRLIELILASVKAEYFSNRGWTGFADLPDGQFASEGLAYAGGNLLKGSMTTTPNGSRCLRLRDRIVSP